MAKIGENKNTDDKNSAIGLSNSVNPNPVALLLFKWKIGLIFAFFECFLVIEEFNSELIVNSFKF